jgi:predicted ATP-binding protein involved in virulence
MKIESINLKNYRAHQDLSVSFQPGFNLVVGLNGSGKTSLLKGVCDALTGFASYMSVPWGYSALDEPDVPYLFTEVVNSRFRFEPQFPVAVTATGEAAIGWGTWSVSKASQVEPGVIDGFAPNEVVEQQLKMLGNDRRSNNASVFPLIAFYRANRQWNGAMPSELQAATERTSRISAYTNWADASADSTAFQAWVIAKCLERYQTSSETGLPFDLIVDDELEFVSEALSTAVEGFSRMKYDLKQKSLLIDWQKDETRTTVSFENLSDGQRAVICLVADIARRMCLLNPVLGDKVVKETPGVVLIDELDIHLHPRWQRILTTGLKRAFPSVQFIAASHSPQVIGELQPEEIILLKQGETAHPQVSYGLSSSQVLEEIMGAEARSADVQKRLGDLFEALGRNEFEFAKTELESLKKDVPGIPELAGVEALLRRKQALGR